MDSWLGWIDRTPFLGQAIPLVLTYLVLILLLAVLHWTLHLFNQIPGATPILLQIRPLDVIVGLTIYLKTSIDFAILIGRLMHLYPGWRNRVAIEVGTALGNAFGTILVIGLWIIFKKIDLLLAIMIFVAALVLLELARDSQEFLINWEGDFGWKRLAYGALDKFLDFTNRLTDPILSRLLPNLGAGLRGREGLNWSKLAAFATQIPFVLGLDDFAGYVPLFSVVNVYGFAIGVLVGHTLLNIALFLSPNRTINLVRNEIVAFLGALAFIGLALYGFVEAAKIILTLFH